MWADTLIELERGHLLRLGLWAVASIVLGLLLFAIFRRNMQAAFVRNFAIQTFAWGLVDAAIVAWAWNSLALRDYNSATQLKNFLWLNVGLDAGYVAVGLTLGITAWILGKRLGALGAGVGVIVQGFALLVLDLRLLTLVETARIALVPAQGGFWLPA